MPLQKKGKGISIEGVSERLNILIVDDQATVRESLLEILEGTAYRGIEAESGGTALEAMRAHEVDLVLLDLGLPDTHGRELIPHIRQIKGDVPIIVVSSTLDMEERLACFGAGADDFITKPFHPGETMARINRSLKNAPSAKTGNLSCGSLTLDHDNKIIRRDGEEIKASAKVFDILYLLLTNPGKTFSREKLGKLIWDGYFVSDNSIWVHMNKVRKLLESSGEGAGRIENRHGIGYCYKPD